jgi:MerR family mercuric resistance operon transcriptional regulator
MAHHTGLLRAQLAKLTGCNLETIRYYEKVGLLPPPPRSANGYRVYSPDLVQRLQFILRARDMGFAMEETRSLLSLTDSGMQTCAEVKHKTEAHLADVRQRIANLRRIEALLSQTAAQCSGDNVPECAILDILRPEEGYATGH